MAVESADDPAFLQRRLRIMFWVCASLVWLGLATHLVLRTISPASLTSHPTFVLIVFVIGAAACAVVCWLVRLSKQRSLHALHALDAVTSIGSGAVFASMVVIPDGRIDEAYFAVIINGLWIVGRALFIPSSRRRTMWLAIAGSALPFGAATFVAINYPERLTTTPEAYVLNHLFAAADQVVLATVGSWVISGLRRQVDEARKLGQYTLGDKIGEGGMGAVYKAQHAMLRRPTAIKLLPADKSGAEAIRRFEREVQLTAELTGPHVVAIFDYGRSPDGTFYYAMEYLDGLDLETLVRDFGPQPPGRVVHILRQVCDALEEAHGRGLIHRDIKPANILLCERGPRSDVAKVVDFGLVRDLDGDLDSSALTSIAGTPAYLSPEAIRDPGAVGAPSDLYAVGAVAYYLLTGAHLFEGKTFAEICGHHLHTPAVAPSKRTERPLPPTLDHLVLRCVAKDPSARPASAAALRAELDALPDLAPWTPADADAWWLAFRKREQPRSAGSVGSTEVDAGAQTIAVDMRERVG